MNKIMPNSNSEAVSVLVVDSHLLMCEMTAMYLNTQENFTAQTAPSFEQAIDTIETEKGFDIVLLNDTVPGVNGLAGVCRMIQTNKGRAVVLFAGNAQRTYITEAIKQGAKGYIPSTLPVGSLVNALRFVASGEIFLPASFITQQDDPEFPDSARLNRQEQRVLRYISQGMTNKEIGREMALSEVTIKMLCRSLCAKLGAKNRTHAAMIAKQMALL